MVTPDPSFKPLGLISIIIVWAGLLFLIRKWPGDKSMSFSLHAAQTKSGQIYYFFLFGTTLPLFYLFIYKWFVPALNLPKSFLIITITGLVGQILAVLVPAIKGRRERIHNFGAYLMAATLMPLSLFIAFADTPVLVKSMVAFSLIYMAATWILHFVFNVIRPNYLYFQAAYVAIFHIIVLLSTYTI